MEAETQDVTMLDVSALTSTDGNNMNEAEGGRTEYRHALQTEQETTVMCSVCFKTWPNLDSFNVHVCMVEGLLQPANVVIIAPPPVVTVNAGVQTPDFSAGSTHEELKPASGRVAEETPRKRKSQISSSTVKVEGKAYGKILPILLPDFIKVKMDIEKNGLTQCDVCKTQFDTSSDLVNHMKKHTGGDLFRCPECPSVFNSKESLQRHSKKHNQNSPTVCSVCKAVFQSPDSCTAHMRTHMGKKAHTCESCNKVFAYRKDYSVHMRTHTGERPYTCDVCGAAFSQKGHLSRHLKTHSGERPHVCDECGATFSIRYRLVEHWRTHTKERPYVCKDCGAAFSHLNTLKFHKRKHSGEKPYCCEHCNARFSHQTHLVVHTRRHTGDRPYKCDVCDASYTRKNLLIIHTRKHTGERPFKCDQCSAAFAQNNYLKDHLRIHTGEKPFECDICHTCFSQRTSLRLHKKNHLNPPAKKTPRSRKEGNMLDRMISDLGRNKQRRTRQAKEALKKELGEDGNTKSIFLSSRLKQAQRAEEEEKPQDFVVLGVARVEDTGITEAEASELDSTLLHKDKQTVSSQQSVAKKSAPANHRSKKSQLDKTGSPIKLKLIVNSSASSK